MEIITSSKSSSKRPSLLKISEVWETSEI